MGVIEIIMLLHSFVISYVTLRFYVISYVKLLFSAYSVLFWVCVYDTMYLLYIIYSTSGAMNFGSSCGFLFTICAF